VGRGLIVYDASAVLALLLREPGADVASAHFHAAVIGAVNFAEVTTRLGKDHDDAAVTATLERLALVVIPLDESLALTAGLMTASTRTAGLSLGDRCCLALAKRLGRPALTADRAWLKIASAVGVEVRLIR